MDYRNLGGSGLKVSPLCLGTMMFGGATDVATSERIVAKAREAGVNFIDTADVYNAGVSEEITGRAIAGPDAGAQLQFVTSFVTEWYGWAAYYPDSDIFGR